MKKIIIALLALAMTTGCSKLDTYMDDFVEEERQAMTFDVKEADIDDIISKNPSMEVRKEIVDREDAGETEGESDLVIEENNNYFVTTETLNVRSGPSAEADKLGELTMGDEIEVLSSEEDEEGSLWVKFAFEDTEGYVLSDYTGQDKSEEPIGHYRVVAYNINLRSEPNSESEVVGKISYFEEFDCYEEIRDDNGDLWLRLKLDGADAYILSDFCIEME